MKRFIATITVFTFFGVLFLHAQPLPDAAPPTRITKERLNPDNLLQNNTRETRYYNDANQLIGTDTEYWINSQWTPQYRTQVSSHFNGSPATISKFEYLGNGNWKEIQREYFTYDNADREILWTVEDYVNNTWILTNRRTQSYTPSGQPLTYQLEQGNWTQPLTQALFTVTRNYNAGRQETDFWYLQSSGSVSYERHIVSSYDAQGRVSSTVRSHKNDANPWVMDEKREFDYGTDNKVDYIKVYLWDNNNWYWPVISDEGYSYLPDRTILTANPLGSFHQSRRTEYFNSSGQKTKIENEYWDNGAQALVVSSVEDWSYTPDGGYDTYSYAIRTNGVLTPNVADHYEYQQYVAVHQPQDLAQVAVFPNPTTDIIQITFSKNDLTEPAQIALYDMSGTLLQTLQTDAPVELLSLASLPKGAYLLHIRRNNQHNCQAVVKQ